MTAEARPTEIAGGGWAEWARRWWSGARPKTLPSAFAPVGVGTALAHSLGHTETWRFVLTMVFALGFTIGTNYLNDYSDGIRGTDDDRVGPVRLVGSGQASAKQVLWVGLFFFAVSAVTGLVLAFTVSWYLLALTVFCALGGWFYTGGEKPYGYRAMGEISCFLFFGPIAVCGTVFIQLGHIPLVALPASVPTGILVSALLVTNNLRDIPTDTVAGKQTLAVLMGERWSRWLYMLFVAIAFAAGLGMAVVRPATLLVLGALPFAVFPARRVMSGARGKDLVAALEHTCLLMLVYGVLFTIALARAPGP